MTDILQCYRCGAALEALSLPLSRQDQCPSCGHYVHVCRMCQHFDRGVARQCREDDAEEVMNKVNANFCDWFAPAPGRYVAADTDPAASANAALDSLFGDGSLSNEEHDPARQAAEDLFRK
ncbi:hypothetical protein [Woeseia oceani]|uniref:Uncharacterized protein n=1 Tax=Woeseia oceani TaxID=1548547 RepID=A0A193LFM2_9GAMM|nr:hypothetical protein [Woeseia oceani]ANO51263.1 hypothetical protein BA177_08660 [Woeseia oceani]